MYNLKDVKAVIFDMDGVIFDTERIYLEEWIQIFESFGYKMTRDIYVPLMGRGRKIIKCIFKEKFGEDIPIEEMYIKKDKMLYEAIDKGIPIKEGAIEIIDFLLQNNFKIALATSAKRERLEKQLKKSGLYKKFDALVSGDDVKNSKPNPEIFTLAAKKINVPCNNCIVIEDSKAGILAAKNAGMIPFHVKDLLEADLEIKDNSYDNFLSLFEIIQVLKRNCLQKI